MWLRCSELPSGFIFGRYPGQTLAVMKQVSLGFPQFLSASALSQIPTRCFFFSSSSSLTDRPTIRRRIMGLQSLFAECLIQVESVFSALLYVT